MSEKEMNNEEDFVGRHPWGAFLEARYNAIIWMEKEMGYDNTTIARHLCEDSNHVSRIKDSISHKKNYWGNESYKFKNIKTRDYPIQNAKPYEFIKMEDWDEFRLLKEKVQHLESKFIKVIETLIDINKTSFHGEKNEQYTRQ